MSVYPTYYYVTGYAVPLTRLIASDNILNDDRFLPYTEGHPGEKLSILIGEQPNVFIGFSSEGIDRYADGDYITVERHSQMDVYKAVFEVFGQRDWLTTEMKTMICAVWR